MSTVCGSQAVFCLPAWLALQEDSPGPAIQPACDAPTAAHLAMPDHAAAVGACADDSQLTQPAADAQLGVGCASDTDPARKRKASARLSGQVAGKAHCRDVARDGVMSDDRSSKLITTSKPGE